MTDNRRGYTVQDRLDDYRYVIENNMGIIRVIHAYTRHWGGIIDATDSKGNPISIDTSKWRVISRRLVK